ncbi:MAG: hypothetical protein V2A34_14670 [Lentisphaerota bacterium]
MNKQSQVILIGCLLAAVGISVSQAQEPVITSLRDGKLTVTNVNNSLEYRVEWASSLKDSNGFRSAYSSIENIALTNNSSMTVDIPQFYRVEGAPGVSNNIIRASDLELVINANTNARYSLEWSESSDGPWNSYWEPFFESTSTGTVVTVPTPRYYRITFLN